MYRDKPPPADHHAACRKPSTARSHRSKWFQLTKAGDATSNPLTLRHFTVHPDGNSNGVHTAVGHRHRFQASFLTSDVPTPIASAVGLLDDVRSRPAWDGAVIEVQDTQFPRVTVDWHDGHGFVVHCWEDQASWGYFLVTRREFSTPSVEVELGGQALERWPSELFSPASHATQAVEYFLTHGAQDPGLEWVTTDGFPREVLWETRAQREAWERAHPRR